MEPLHQRTPINTAFDAYVDEVDLLESEAAAQKPMLGYPSNCHQLKALLPLHNILHRDYTLNNCGDPLDNVEKPWKFNSLKQEGRLLTRLMEPWGGSPENCWGYITTGGTEGVTKGISVGYKRLRARGYTNILVLYSQAAHYCVPKAATVVAHSCKKISIEVSDTNSMQLETLREVLCSSRQSKVEAVMVCCTLGSTFFGGCDDVEGVKSVLIEHGYDNNSSYLHIDAALHGGFWQDDRQTPKYQIDKDFDSISISGHKWYGGFIAGCFLVTKEGSTIDPIDKSQIEYVDYVDMVDKFISGSRSGAAAVLWMARLLQFDWQAELDRCHENRDYLVNALSSLGLKVASQHVNVLMPRPSAELAKKWQLMCVGDECQVLILPHASLYFLEEFVEDVKQDVHQGAVRPPTERLSRLTEHQ